LLSSNISSTCSHNMVNFGPLAVEIGAVVWGTPANSTGFASWLCYCSDVAQRKPTKLCTICFTVSWAGSATLCPYMHFRGLLPPERILPGAKFTLRPSRCVIQYWQRYCTALQQRASATRVLRSVVQGMELRNSQRATPIFSTAAITLGSGHWPTF